MDKKYKRLTIRISIGWYNKLEKVRKREYYTSIQEVIYELIRKAYIKPKPVSITGRPVGRPKKFQFEDYFSKPTRESRKIGKMYK